MDPKTLRPAGTTSTTAYTVGTCVSILQTLDLLATSSQGGQVDGRLTTPPQHDHGERNASRGEARLSDEEAHARIEARSLLNTALEAWEPFYGGVNACKQWHHYVIGVRVLYVRGQEPKLYAKAVKAAIGAG